MKTTGDVCRHCRAQRRGTPPLSGGSPSTPREIGWCLAGALTNCVHQVAAQILGQDIELWSRLPSTISRSMFRALRGQWCILHKQLDRHLLLASIMNASGAAWQAGNNECDSMEEEARPGSVVLCA
jgi:hypothetical protein